jgi:uncharacterized protein YyaL (SSP411 family)
MKKYILTIMIFQLIYTISYSQELLWNSWEEGYEIAVKENKMMLVFVHASWCHQCQRMDKYVFNNPEIAKLIIENYVPVKFDIEAKMEYRIEEELIDTRNLLDKICKAPVRGIPTTIFWKPGGNKQNPVTGLKDPDEMSQILEEMM